MVKKLFWLFSLTTLSIILRSNGLITEDSENDQHYEDDNEDEAIDEPENDEDIENFDDFENVEDEDPQFERRSGAENERPIIGILTHKFHPDVSNSGRHNCSNEAGAGKSFVYTTTAKYFESGGARMAPIFADRDESYLKKMFDGVNGIYFPGVDASLIHSDYAKAGTYLYNLAVQANDRGTYFPLWGECLGLQFLLFVAAGSKKTYKTRCAAMNQSYAIDFTDAASNSRLYGKAPKIIRRTMATKKINMNNHKFCISIENFGRMNFKQEFRALTTNLEEESETTFVSTAEAVNYPFYALGFIPETNIYDIYPNYNIDHSSEAARVSQFFAKFFVDETRKNWHKFPTLQEEQESLLYNWQTSCYSAYYFFPIIET